MSDELGARSWAEYACRKCGKLITIPMVLYTPPQEELGEAVELTIQLLREIARRSPEVLRHTDIEAFIEYELEPLKAVRAGHAGYFQGPISMVYLAHARCFDESMGDVFLKMTEEEA